MPLVMIPIRMLLNSCRRLLHTKRLVFEGYVVSTSRYIILEDLGCLATSHPSLLAVVLAFGPHTAVSLAAFIYSCKSG